MSSKSKIEKRPNVVGVVSDWSGLREAIKIDKRLLDFIEIRLDAFKIEELDIVYAMAEMIEVPLIITMRSVDEGGKNPDLTDDQRRYWMRHFMNIASCVDVEICSLYVLAEIVEMTKVTGISLIASHHQMKGCVHEHFDLGVAVDKKLVVMKYNGAIHVMKIAIEAATLDDVVLLDKHFNIESPHMNSFMCVGKFGMESRLLFAKRGSVLNYGYLGREACSGQWPALQMKNLIAQMA